MKRLLLFVLLVAVSAALAAPARATTCQQKDTVTDTSGFSDCAGRSTIVDYVSSTDIQVRDTGTWTGDDWFTDFHVTFEPVGDSVVTVGGSFNNLTETVSWTTETMSSNGMIWFTADDFADRVSPGDTFQWYAYASFSSGTATATDVTIAYTMDVPEPALGIVLLGGLVSVALLRRRAA